MEGVIEIDCSLITDWESFHDVFMENMGFPDFYGRNLNAWIDCMSSLADPEEGLTKVHCSKGEVVTLNLKNASSLKKHTPEIYEALSECSAFVNYRQLEVGEPAVLALAYDL